MKAAAVLMLVLVLFGCDRTTRVEEPWPPQKSGEREEVPAAPTLQENPGRSAPDEAVPPELDLTFPAMEAQESSAPDWTMSDHRRLPDLFANDGGGRKAERRLSIGARLLLEEDEPDYREAVEGGEIQLKLKTR